MNTDKSERNTINEDSVYFRKNEKVVDVKIERSDLWRRKHWVRKFVRGRVNNHTVEIGSLSELEVDETLTIRNRNRREGKTRIRVEPEEKRDPEFKSVVRSLACLVTAEDVNLSARSNWSICNSDGLYLAVFTKIQNFLVPYNGSSPLVYPSLHGIDDEGHMHHTSKHQED
jgi:hypothetical protein